MKRRGNGEGTLFKRKDGRWSAQVSMTLANGATKRVCITLKSREAVKKRMHELLMQENNHIPYSEKDWTVAEYLDYWLRDVQKNHIRETTKSLYTFMIKKYIKPTVGNHKVRNLSVYDIRRAMDALTERGCSGRTLQKYLQILTTCLGCAMREELVARNVAQLVEKPKYKAKETMVWTAEQAALFLLVNRNHPQYIAFLLFLTYGMRRGEVLGLRYSDIDFDNGLIHVRQQIDRINGKIMARDLKTANSHRSLPLIADIRTALLAHAKKNGIILPCFNPSLEYTTKGTVVVSRVGTPLEPRNLARCFDELTKKAGLPRIKIHAMRHTAATVLKDLNVPVKDVQLILGHSDIATTLNIYQHGTPETHRSAISAIGERLLVI
jgi:integrase